MGGGYEKSETEGKGGTLTVTARVSNGASRYAMPSLNISDFVYAALLYKDDESPADPSPEKFVEGVPNESGDKFVFSFQRPDETDGLTLEVFAFKAGPTDFSKDNALLSGKKTGLKVSGDKIEVVETIALEVNKSSTEKGTVSLQIKVPDGCTLEIKELKIDGTIETNPHFAITDNAPDFTITQNGTGIDAKVYKVTFTVKKVDETDDAKEEIIHIFTESINVFPGMCTDTWWNGNVSAKTKVITQDMISSTVYVRGAGGYYDNTPSYNNDETYKANDTNSGSFLSPLATIQKAVDTIIARNNGSSDYTIYIDGTLKYNENTTYIGANGMADFSALTKNLKLTIKALSNKATLDGGAVFGADGTLETGGIEKYIINTRLGTNGTLKLTLENLDITGGSNGGVYVWNYSTCTIKDCTISKNSTNMRGGGVYISSGTFTMESGTISGNKATTDCGGGIYAISGGTFIMNGGKITDNTAKSNGGGVYVYGGTFTMTGGEINKNNATDGSGGGVYIFENGTFTMQGGVISENNTPKNAGGVFVNNSTFIMEDGTISKNEASYGGGIYLYRGGTFTMQKGSISGNNAFGETQDDGTINGGDGGGIYVSSGNTFTMTGGTISDCTATTNGGGIYSSSNNSVINGGTISENNARNGGGINSQGGLTIKGGEITSNTATKSGGGLFIFGRLDINGGTISGNTAGTYGGGIYYQAGTQTITGGTIENNQASMGSCIYLDASLKLQGGTISGDVCLKNSTNSLTLLDNAVITDGVIDLTEFTDSSEAKRVVYIGGTLMQNFVAKIKLGTAYQPTDPILQGYGYALTEADCKRFAIDGDTYKIAFLSGYGILVP